VFEFVRARDMRDAAVVRGIGLGSLLGDDEANGGSRAAAWAAWLADAANLRFEISK
jgi:hypothetical protein